MNDPTRSIPPAADEEPIPAAREVAETVTQNAGPTHPSPSEVPMAAPVPDDSVGGLGSLGVYRIIKLLGEGGMGAVYAAEDTALKRRVALKTMKADLARNEASRARFIREAQTAAAVEHDHIVRIYYVGEDRDIPFIAMEYLRGKPLDAWMKANTASVSQVLKIGFETALGLAAAHAKGLVHRDIKPANIWLEAPNGRIKILDFGLARSSCDEGLLTGQGVILGTPAYMAPEQARGLHVDFRCDLFSLGGVLYHLATGKRPFTGSNTLAILTSLAVDTPTPPHVVNPVLPIKLSALIMRLLAKRPEDRPTSASAVAEELRRINKGEVVAPAPMPVVYAQEAAPAVETPSVETLWEDVAVTGEASEVASAPSVRRSSSISAYVLMAGSVLLILGLALGMFRLMSNRGKPPVEVAEEPEPTKPSKPPKPSIGKPKPSADPIPAMTPIKPEVVFTLDHLDPAKNIPAEQRFDWQPKEVVAVLGSHRQRLWGPATALTLAASGQFVAGHGRMWDLATLRETTVPQGVLSPDGKRVAAGDKVWSVADPKAEPIRYAIDSTITQFVTERIVLARSGADVIVWLLDEKNPKPLAKFTACLVATASPDGKTLAIFMQAEGAKLELHEVSETAVTKKAILPGPEGQLPVTAYDGPWVSFSTSGRLATLSPDGKLMHVWNVTGPEPKHLVAVTQPEAQAYVGVRLAAAGDRAVCWGGTNFEVWLLDAEKPRRIDTSKATGFLNDGLSTVLYSPDGKTIISGHANGAVRFWRFENDVIAQREALKPQPTDGSAIVIAPDGRSVIMRAEDQTLYYWNLATLAPFRLYEPSANTATFAPDGRTMTTAGLWGNWGVGQRWRLDADTPKPIRTFGSQLSSGLYFPDGKWLLVGSLAGTAGLAVWDLSADPPQEKFPSQDVYKGAPVAFTPDGRYLVSYDTKAVTLSAMTERGLYETHQETSATPIVYTALSPDGKTLVSGGTDGLRVFDRKDGKLFLRINFPGSYTGVGYSPDGKTLVCTTLTQVRLLDATDGRLLREWTFPGAPAGAVYHPDGRHLIVSNLNRTVYILRLAEANKKP